MSRSSNMRRSSSHTRRPSRTSCCCWADPTRRTAGGCVASRVRPRVLPHGGEPIECDPSGCCLWRGRGAVGVARRSLYVASRGSLPASARLEQTCERRRCVNLDHVRVVRAVPATMRDVERCLRGHELTSANAVRHRDGRIAYCRLCRNARRRERYAHDAAYAQQERARQRTLRRSARWA